MVNYLVDHITVELYRVKAHQRMGQNRKDDSSLCPDHNLPRNIYQIRYEVRYYRQYAVLV
jgi:hypothetical protein